MRHCAIVSMSCPCTAGLPPHLLQAAHSAVAQYVPIAFWTVRASGRAEGLHDSCRCMHLRPAPSGGQAPARRSRAAQHKAPREPGRLARGAAGGHAGGPGARGARLVMRSHFSMHWLQKRCMQPATSRASLIIPARTAAGPLCRTYVQTSRRLIQCSLAGCPAWHTRNVNMRCLQPCSLLQDTMNPGLQRRSAWRAQQSGSHCSTEMLLPLAWLKDEWEGWVPVCPVCP